MKDNTARMEKNSKARAEDKKKSLVSKFSFSLSHWGNIYIFSNIVFNLLRYLIWFTASYIHPDEFFQSFQYLYQENIPWEFQDGSYSRSYAPLFIFYVPVIKMLKWIDFEEPMMVYYSVRLLISSCTWVITDYCVNRMLRDRDTKVNTRFLINTSYISLCHQSHTFSNSIETFLLLIVLTIINDLRNASKRNRQKEISNIKLVLLGLLISLGMFNRITFIAWLVVPFYFLFNFLFQNPLRTILTIGQGFVIFTIFCIGLDTYQFSGELPRLTDPSTWIITPLNNLLYNSRYENLSAHGIHPYYQHILINYPMIFGPMILFTFPFNKRFAGSTTFLSAISGLIILSFIPHQELRFLQPLVPLVASNVSFDFSSEKIGRLIILAWVLFNLVFCLIMGIFHQGGIVYALFKLRIVMNTSDDYVLVFWRTYKPPTFLLRNPEIPSKITYYNKDETDFLSFDYSYITSTKGQNIIFDLMGTPSTNVSTILGEIKENTNNTKKVYFVAPLASTLDERVVNWDVNLALMWSTLLHYDFDHFEFDQYGTSTFKPGLGIYELL